MEIRDVTEKHRNFAADYDAGMDRAQLCAKYTIPDAQFETFMKYLARSGILKECPLPPRPLSPGQDEEKICLIPKSRESMLSMILQHIVFHKGKVIASFLALATVCFLISQGASSLTGRMWAKTYVHSKEKYYKNVPVYVRSEHPLEMYLELSTDKKEMRYKVSINREDMRREQTYEWLGIADYSKVPREDRRHISYDLLVFRTETTLPQEDYKIITNGHFSFLMARIETATSFSLGTMQKKVIPIVLYKEYSPVVSSMAGLILRAVATPFTLAIDIVLIPACYVAQLIAMLTHFGV